MLSLVCYETGLELKLLLDYPSISDRVDQKTGTKIIKMPRIQRIKTLVR